MEKLVRVLAPILVVACAVAAAYLIWVEPSSPPPKEEEPAGVDPGAVPAMLPGDTVAYLRLEEPGRLVDRVVLERALRDPSSVRQTLREWYDRLFEGAAEGGEGPSPERVRDFVASARTVHLGVVPYRLAAGEKWEDVREALDPILFVELADEAPLRALASEMGDQVVKRSGGPGEGWDLKATGKPAIAVLQGNLLVVGREAAVEESLAMGVSKKDSLARSGAFRTALSEFGSGGALFAFADLARLRDLLAAGIDQRPFYPPEYLSAEEKERMRREDLESREQEKKSQEAWSEFGAVGASVQADGRLAIRVYASEGRTIPPFLVRESARRKLLERIPVAAPLVLSVGYSGGRETRQGLADWIREKTSGGVRLEDLPIEAPMAEVLTERLEELEKDVVVMSREFLVAAIPVDRELALAVAPLSDGRWGAAVAFDYQDRGQVETLFRKLCEEGERAELPWKVSQFQDLSIRYLDVAEMAREKGGEVPAELAEIDLRFGYAIGPDYAYAGTVGLIEALHAPSGPTLSGAIDEEGVDGLNSYLLHLRPGPLVHGPRLPSDSLARIQEALALQVPAEAQYSITGSADSRAITIRSSVPLATLAAWIAFDEGLHEAFSPPKKEEGEAEVVPIPPSSIEEEILAAARFVVEALDRGDDDRLRSSIDSLPMESFDVWRTRLEEWRALGFSGDWRVVRVFEEGEDGRVRAYLFPVLPDGDPGRRALWLVQRDGGWHPMSEGFEEVPEAVEIPR